MFISTFTFGTGGYMGQKTILKYDFTVGTDWYNLAQNKLHLNTNHTFSMQQVISKKFVFGLGYKFGSFSRENISDLYAYSQPNLLDLKFNSIEGQFLFYTTAKSVIAPIGSYVGFKIGYNRIHGDFTFVKSSYSYYSSSSSSNTTDYTDKDGYTYSYKIDETNARYKQKISTVTDFQLYLVWGKQKIYSNHLVVDYGMELNGGMPFLVLTNLYLADSSEEKISPYYVSSSLTMAYLLTARIGIGFNFKLF